LPLAIIHHNDDFDRSVTARLREEGKDSSRVTVTPQSSGSRPPPLPVRRDLRRRRSRRPLVDDILDFVSQSFVDVVFILIVEILVENLVVVEVFFVEILVVVEGFVLQILFFVGCRPKSGGEFQPTIPVAVAAVGLATV
jgi:hypothetical protein